MVVGRWDHLPRPYRKAGVLEPGSLVPRPGKFHWIALEPEKDSGGLIWEASPFPPVVG